jgi:hypothetical protein
LFLRFDKLFNNPIKIPPELLFFLRKQKPYLFNYIKKIYNFYEKE